MKGLARTILLLCVALLAFGLYELFKLRYELGDIYPEYSSLRADPIGTMVFYESLEQMPHLKVRRDFSSENRLPHGGQTTYLHLSAPWMEWTSVPVEVFEEIQRFVTQGGRLAITFFPETSHAGRTFTATTTPPPTKKGKVDDEPGRPVSLKEKWGVEFRLVALEQGDRGVYRPVKVTREVDLPLPDTLNWHSGLVFTNLDSSWETIYARSNQPVVIERQFGAGSVVLATDTFFLSNEAMTRDRHANFLSWLVGRAKFVVFDEAHLGIVESPGVVTLMRGYGLHWFGGAVLLLVALFVWKNASSFVPPTPELKESEHVAGKDAGAAFVNLLRRNIAPRDVLKVCFEQWTKSLVTGGAHAISRVDQAQTIFEAENAQAKSERDPVGAYRKICHVLQRGASTRISQERSSTNP